VLRIFGPKREEVTGGCRKSHNKELIKYYYDDQIKWDGMNKAYRTHGRDKKCI
jgi:hypothetical protein